MYKGFLTSLVGLAGAIIFTASAAYAIPSLHPIELYQKGIAQLELYKGDPQQLASAEEFFTEITKKFPDSPYGYLGLSRVNLIDAYLYDNRCDMKKVRYEVLPYAVKALELGPSVAEVHEHYNHLENVYAEFQKNQKQAQQALLTAPDDPQTYFLIGNFVAEQHQPSKALEFYETALDMAPPDELRLRLLKRIALIYLNELENPSKAVEYYDAALKINGHLPEITEYQGVAYLKMKNYREAVAKLTESLTLIQTTLSEYSLWQARGLMAEEQGKVKEAVQFLEKAAAFVPGDISLHWKIGNLYYQLANYEAAYKYFEEVLQKEPDNIGAYFLAGRTAQLLGNAAIAMDHFRKYLQFDSQSAEANWIRENVPEFTLK